MATLRVKEFNFITSGNTEKLFNLDISYDKYDQKSALLGTQDVNKQTIIQQQNTSFLTNTREQQRKKEHDVNSEIRNVTFVAGIDVDNDKFSKGNSSNRFSLYDGKNDVIIHPLYDIKDISIKSSIKKVKNPGIRDQYNSNDYVDIYAPSISSNPITICQMGNYSYVLTERMNQGPNILRTTLISQRENTPEENIHDTDYRFVINQYDLNTYVYDSSGNEKEHISSYYQPKYNLENIKYNYIFELPQNFSNPSLRNDYKVGDIQGDIFQCKNTYNSTYSMQMSSQTSLDNSRDYIGIGICGGNMYLKYYDNISYKGIITDNQVNQLSNINMKQEDVKSYPYQKIETLESINRFKNTIAHKSNLYSVSIRNTRFEQLDTEENRGLMNKLKMDIKNNVRDICKQLSPANTQLFDVYFDEAN